MGVLAPLFFAGLAALSLPLLFHLIRRTPKGRQEFSSLMFLAPSPPPRLTRRSRLDQVLLLLLRLAALSLLAMAFARPFLRSSALLSLEDLPPKRVAILVDVSASMRRGDLWKQAVAQVEKELDDLAPQDEVALFTFSDRLETAVRFPTEPGALRRSSADAVRQRLRTLEPTWVASDLGNALSTLATELTAASTAEPTSTETQIVLVSDLQQGSGVEVLGGFDWPEQVRLITRQLLPQQTTNAYARLLEAEPDSPDDAPRVRVANAANSAGDQFFIHWATDGAAEAFEGETAVYVPPGQSRVVRLPRPKDNLAADRIILRGDDHDFDNTYFVAPPHQQDVTILYAGNDAADDPQGSQHYLRLAASGNPLRRLTLQPLVDDPAPLQGPLPPQVVVATAALAAPVQSTIRTYVEQGGTLLLAPNDRPAAEALALYLDGVSLRDPPAKMSEDDFALLGEIDFSHALFAPFANPRYSDFTKIHFWNHQPVTLTQPAETHAVARFDNGDPWILERRVGAGRVFAFTSGWRPDDSQLAVSSKFVTLIGGLLDLACGETQAFHGVEVNQTVSLPEGRETSLVVQAPGAREVVVPVGSSSLSQTQQPGIYRVGAGKDELRFAVNLSTAESRTEPLDLQRLEQLGVRIGTPQTRAEQLNLVRYEQDVELEGRQKVWRWLLVACLALLIIETWWAGRAARPALQPVEGVA